MKLLHARNLSAALVIALLAGCVTQPSQRVVYRDNGNGGGHNYGASQVCHECGTIRGIEQIEYRAGNSGGGAVLGAIIGGVLGSTIGKGNGRTAATVGGAVVGGFAGNAGAIASRLMMVETPRLRSATTRVSVAAIRSSCVAIISIRCVESGFTSDGLIGRSTSMRSPAESRRPHRLLPIVELFDFAHALPAGARTHAICKQFERRPFGRWMRHIA